MIKKGSSATVRELLTRLTGFEHAVFVQSGTAAQQLVMSTLFETKASIAVPALGCWTIPNAVLRAGAEVVIHDIDSYWGLDPAPVKTKTAVMVDPWSVPSNWTGLNRGISPIVDMTLSPGSTNHGKLAGEVFAAGFLSLGAGKPLDIGAGGVALFNCASAARDALQRVRFGIADGRWMTASDRYVFASPLLSLLEESLKDAQARLPYDREDGAWLRAEIPSRLKGFGTNPIRPNSTLGLRSAIPIVLPEVFPLTTKELEAPALMSGLALSRHPVGPPYLEPAWEGKAQPPAVRSESLSLRLMFFEPGENPRKQLRQLCDFIERALNMVPKLKLPYVLDLNESELTEKALRAQCRGFRVCRGIDRSLYIYDEILGTARRLYHPK